MRKHLVVSRSVGVCLLALLFVLPYSRAQEFRATLSGQVTDPSGAVVVNAAVKAVSNDSGTTYTAQTTKDGTYYIPYVLPGAYKMTVTAKGFKTAVQDDVRLFAAQGFGQNFKLEVGGVAEQVEVTSAPPELETTTGSGGQLIEERELQAVPLNGNQAYMLIGTTPGSQFMTTQFGPGGNSGTRGWDVTNNYTIGGGAQSGAGGSFNQFTLNGINITQQTSYANQQSGAWNVSPNIDTISEVNVMTTSYDARFSRTAGGTVNVVTKAGENHIHGDVYETYNGGLMNANTFQGNLFGTPRQGQVENQYDATIGGPIFKNRLFYFGGFEGYNESIAGYVLENVPPAYLRPGYNGNAGVDFGLAATLDPTEFGPTTTNPAGLPVYQPGTAACADGGPAAACSNHSNDLYQTLYPNDTIPAPFNATALAILNYIPLPNLPNASNFARGNNYYGPSPDLYHYYQPTVRVDYNLSDKTKLYSYFEWQTGTEFRSGNGLPGLAASGNINQIRENWAAAQDVTHTFSPTLLLDAKVSFARYWNQAPDGNLALAQPPSALGLSMPLPPTTTFQDVPEFTVGDSFTGGIIGGGQIFGNQKNQDVTTNTSLDADLTKTKGAHNFHFGGNLSEFQYGNPGFIGHANGDFQFGSQFTQYNPTNNTCYSPNPMAGNQCNSNQANGSSLADLLLGYPGGGGVDWNDTIFEGEPVFAIYAQDDWRVSHRLTLNLGIRWDVQRGLRERHNALNRGMCLTCVNPVTTDTNYQSNVASSSNIAAWQAAGIDPTTLQQVLGGIIFPGVNGQSRDGYNTEWTDIGPRIGFAYALDPTTVVRGGWGIVYQGGLEGGSSSGFTETTPYLSSQDGGITPTNTFNSGTPFSNTALVKPVGNSLGELTNLGGGAQAFDFPGRKLPREQVFSFGFQHEFPGKIVLDARYAANYTTKLRTFLWLNSDKSLSQFQAAIANPSIWTQQVPNPYYNVSAAEQGGSGCGSAPTIWALDLIEPLGQYCSQFGPSLVGEYNAPLGRNWYNGLEVKLNRHIYGSNRGLFFQVAYTWSKTISGDGYPFGWPFQGSAGLGPDGISTNQQHIIQNSDRTHVMAFTPVWDLPIGKGSMFFPNPSAPVGLFINGWTLSSVTTYQSGQPVGLNNGWTDTAPLGNLRPAHGTSQGMWMYTPYIQNPNGSGLIPKDWHQVQNVLGYTWGLQTTPTQSDVVRTPTIANFDIALQKTTPIGEKVNFILRLNAFNALNSPLFGGPDSNPGDGPPQYVAGVGWQGFGTVGPYQQNFPRILKVSGKITF